MASGDTLFVLKALGNSPTGTLYATFDTVSDASTPTATHNVLDFDGSTDEYMDWHLVIPAQYSGNTGFTFKYSYAMSSTDANIVDLEISVAKVVATTVLTADLGLDTATPVSIPDTPTGTANATTISPTGALAKADMGTPVAGDDIIIRVQRDAQTVSNANDLQLISVTVTET